MNKEEIAIRFLSEYGISGNVQQHSRDIAQLMVRFSDQQTATLQQEPNPA